MLADDRGTDAGSKAGTAPFERIVLTGFRATGKSAVGRSLAALLEYRFVDTDRVLAEDMQCSIREFVRSRGWAAFRERERLLLERLACERDAVIATGGGAVMHRKEWDLLRCNSLVVWLQADAETIRQRLRNDSASGANRPPLTAGGALDEVSGLLAEREPLYRRGSDLQLDTTELSPEEIAALIQGECITRRKAD